MCLVLQDSRVCAFLWLKAAIVSNCCVKNTINLICHGASHFELAALILFFLWNVRCFPITMEKHNWEQIFHKIKHTPTK